jgi:hypothetical protein
MKIASNAQVYVDRIKEEFDNNTFLKIMESAYQMTNRINICHLELVMKRIAGEDKTKLIIHSRQDRERAIGAVGVARTANKIPHISRRKLRQ